MSLNNLTMSMYQPPCLPINKHHSLAYHLLVTTNMYFFLSYNKSKINIWIGSKDSTHT